MNITHSLSSIKPYRVQHGDNSMDGYDWVELVTALKVS